MTETKGDAHPGARASANRLRFGPATNHVPDRSADVDVRAPTTTATIVPTLRYRDAFAAIDWLERAFGFRRHFVVEDGEGGVAHAQLTFGNGMIMLSSAHDDEFGKMQRPLESADAPVSQSPYVIVTDVDAHHARALAAGAVVVMEPEDKDYGGRGYGCRDPEGNLWSFGSYDPWQDEA